MYRKKVFLGSLIKTFTDWVLPSRLPKAFRVFLKAHEDEVVQGITVYRSPLDGLSNGVINALTLGDWESIKKKSSVDKLFHVYAIIRTDGGQYIYEKEAIPRLGNASDKDLNRPNAEELNVPIHHEITLSQFVERAISAMGDRFYTYDAWNNNCQDFLLGSVRANHLQNNAIVEFLKQDVEELVKNTPEYSKYFGGQATDLAGAGERLWSEVADKRGGRIGGFGRNRRLF